MKLVEFCTEVWFLLKNGVTAMLPAGSSNFDEKRSDDDPFGIRSVWYRVYSRESQLFDEQVCIYHECRFGPDNLTSHFIGLKKVGNKNIDAEWKIEVWNSQNMGQKEFSKIFDKNEKCTIWESGQYNSDLEPKPEIKFSILQIRITITKWSQFESDGLDI